MGRIDGAEVLVRGLRAEGVRAVFAITDVSYAPVLRSAEECGIRIVGGRHESANVHMAEGWARASGEVAVAMATMGPGVANMVPGAFTAWNEGFPVLLLGTQRTERADRSIRRGRFQHSPQIDALRPITKFAATVPDAARIPEYLREAFRHALTGRPGPAYLELQVDVLREELDDEGLRFPEPERYRASAGAPDAGAMRRAAEMIGEAEFPLVLAGQGVLRAGAGKELQALVDRIGAAVMTTPSARGAIDEDHPRVVATPLMSPGGARAALEADVVIAAGTEVSEIVGYGRPPQWREPGEQRWIQLNVDPASIGVNREVDVALVGDARAGLAALAALAPEREPADAAVECAEFERGLLDQLKGELRENEACPIHPGRLAVEVADFFPRDGITCFDGGNTALWAFMSHRFHAPRSLLWTGHFGHLGTGLPYAIAAKLVSPERPVHLITGDSALGFNLAELETAAREQVDIVVVVSCDYAWGMEVLGEQEEIGRAIGTETSHVRYDEVALGLGCHGAFVQRPEEIRPALEQASRFRGPAVVQVDVDPSENASPPFLAEFLEMYEAREA